MMCGVMIRGLITGQVAMILGTGALLPAPVGADDGPAPDPPTIPSAPRTFRYSSGIQEWQTLPPSRLDQQPAANTHREVAPATFVCGPQLAVYRNGQRVSDDASPTLPEAFEVRPVGDELHLLIGPRVSHTRFGSGYCGSCPRFGAALYRIDKAGKVSKLLDIQHRIDPPRIEDGDIHHSDDWSSFTARSRTRSGRERPTAGERRGMPSVARSSVGRWSLAA